jgi:hypothetical protein
LFDRPQAVCDGLLVDTERVRGCGRVQSRREVSVEGVSEALRARVASIEIAKLCVQECACALLVARCQGDESDVGVADDWLLCGERDATSVARLLVGTAKSGRALLRVSGGQAGLVRGHSCDEVRDRIDVRLLSHAEPAQ